MSRKHVIGAIWRSESSFVVFVGFGGLDDSSIKGLTGVLRVGQVLSVKACKVQHKRSRVMVQKLS
jgi:hypothetical protein